MTQANYALRLQASIKAEAERLAKATGNWDTGGSDGGGSVGTSGTQKAANQLNLAPRPGLEPGTHGLTVRCSAS